jgi:hypothetical protein
MLLIPVFVHNDSHLFSICSIQELREGKDKCGKERDLHSSQQKIIQLQLRRFNLKIQGQNSNFSGKYLQYFILYGTHSVHRHTSLGV